MGVPSACPDRFFPLSALWARFFGPWCCLWCFFTASACLGEIGKRSDRKVLPQVGLNAFLWSEVYRLRLRVGRAISGQMPPTCCDCRAGSFFRTVGNSRTGGSRNRFHNQAARQKIHSVVFLSSARILMLESLLKLIGECIWVVDLFRFSLFP